MMEFFTERMVLTVGHSNHTVERFVELLRSHAVAAIVDVRSQPASRIYPDFNREPFAAALRSNGIAYAFLGNELGARPKDAACYENGRVQYRKLAETELFKTGIRRVVKGSASQRLALVCAEKEPLACHRTLLVSPAVEAAGLAIAHIHADGSLESQADALRRLPRMLGMPEVDLFRTAEQIIAEAMAVQEQRIAYVDEGMRRELE